MRTQTDKQIERIIEWYLKDGYKVQNDLLIQSRAKLAAHSYYLATMADDAHRSYLQAERDRKQAYILKKVAFMESGDSATKADAKAQDQISGYFQTEANFEAEYRGTKIRLEQVNRVLDAMSQQISRINQELRTQSFVEGQNK